MTLTLATDRTGDFECEINGADAYIVGDAKGRRYLYTPLDRHIWLDSGGARCADLGQLLDDIPAPPGDARQEAFDDWAAQIIDEANRSGVRLE